MSKKRLSRRDFLRLGGVTGVAAIAGFSPLGNIVTAGLVHIPRNTNFCALLYMYSKIDGITSLGICSITSVE